MISLNTHHVVTQMILHAEILSDFSALFHGSPRRFMEVPGQSVSSGPGYKALYDLGLTRTGRGTNAVWYIPPEIVRQHLAA